MKQYTKFNTKNTKTENEPINSLDPKEVDHNEPPHLDLLSLP